MVETFCSSMHPAKKYVPALPWSFLDQFHCGSTCQSCRRVMEYQVLPNLLSSYYNSQSVTHFQKWPASSSLYIVASSLLVSNMFQVHSSMPGEPGASILCVTLTKHVLGLSTSKLSEGFEDPAPLPTFGLLNVQWIHIIWSKWDLTLATAEDAWWCGSEQTALTRTKHSLPSFSNPSTALVLPTILLVMIKSNN